MFSLSGVAAPGTGVLLPLTSRASARFLLTSCLFGGSQGSTFLALALALALALTLGSGRSRMSRTVCLHRGASFGFVRHGRGGISQAARVLAAGAAVVSGGGSCAGGVSLHARRGTRAGPIHGAHDDGDATVPSLIVSGTVRPSAGTGLPSALVARSPPHRLGNGDWAGGRHGGGVCPRGTARSDSNRDLCGGAQPAGLDRSAVAGQMGLKATGGGPAAQHDGGLGARRQVPRLTISGQGSTPKCARRTGASAAGGSPAGGRRQATISTPSHGSPSARMEAKR